MTANGARIAVVSSSEDRATVAALAERLGDLVARGWDARLVFDGPAAARHGASPGAAERPELSRRVDLSSACPRGVPNAGGGASPLGSTFQPQRPGGTARRRKAAAGAPAGEGSWVGADRASPANRPLRFRPLCPRPTSAARSHRLQDGAAASASPTSTALSWTEWSGMSTCCTSPLNRSGGAGLRLAHSIPARKSWPPGARTQLPRPGPVRDDARRLAASSRPLRVVSVALRGSTDTNGLPGHPTAARHGLRLPLPNRWRRAYREALGFTRSELDLGIGSSSWVRRARSSSGRSSGGPSVILDATVVHGPESAVPEGQAMALPVVATDRTDLTTAAAYGDHAFVVRPRDPHALAEKLALLADDPVRRRRMGQAVAADCSSGLAPRRVPQRMSASTWRRSTARRIAHLPSMKRDGSGRAIHRSRWAWTAARDLPAVEESTPPRWASRAWWTLVGRRSVSEPLPGVRLATTPAYEDRSRRELRSAVVDVVLCSRGLRPRRGDCSAASKRSRRRPARRAGGAGCPARFPFTLSLARLRRMSCTSMPGSFNGCACQPLVRRLAVPCRPLLPRHPQVAPHVRSTSAG